MRLPNRKLWASERVMPISANLNWFGSSSLAAGGATAAGSFPDLGAVAFFDDAFAGDFAMTFAGLACSPASASFTDGLRSRFSDLHICVEHGAKMQGAKVQGAKVQGAKSRRQTGRSAKSKRNTHPLHHNHRVS